MTQYFRKVAFAGMAVGLLCFMAHGALAKDPERPFRSRGEGISTPAPELCGPGGDLSQEWGNATHLGKYYGETCGFIVGAVSPTVLVSQGHGIVIAANGDEVDVVFQGLLDVGSDPWVGDYTISVVGGTGRFEHASGQIQYTQLRPASGNSFTTSAAGTLSY
jgi:hypothetical protein